MLSSVYVEMKSVHTVTNNVNGFKIMLLNSLVNQNEKRHDRFRIRIKLRKYWQIAPGFGAFVSVSLLSCLAFF